MTTTIHVTSTHSGDEWRAHLQAELAARHPGTDVRVERGHSDHAHVWDDALVREPAWSDDQLRAVAEAVDQDDDVDEFDAMVRTVDELAERVERECASIFVAWRLASALRRLKAWLSR